MANREYIITFRNETSENVEARTTAPTQSGTESQTQSEKESKFKLGKGKVVAAFGLSVADRVVSQQINTISLRTGYEEKQQKAQLGYSVAKKASTSLLAIGMGIATGNVGTALFGVALSGVNELVNYGLRQQEINYARQVENNTIFLNQIRMGAGLNREGKTR